MFFLTNFILNPTEYNLQYIFIFFITYDMTNKSHQAIKYEKDLLQVQYAIKNGCDVFITEDKGIHKRSYGIEVVGLDDVAQIKT